MRRPDGLLDGAARALSTRLASGMTRRSFLGRMGGAVLAATGGAAVAAAVRPEKSEAFHFCGHTWYDRIVPAPARQAAAHRPAPASRLRGARRVIPIDNLGRPVECVVGRVGGSGKPLARRRWRTCRRRRGRSSARTSTTEPYGIAPLHRRRLVPLLRRPGPQARRLLLDEQEADQRRRGPAGLLLQEPQGVLRHVLRHRAELLAVAAALAATAPPRRSLRRLVALRPFHGRDLHSRRVREPPPSTPRNCPLCPRGDPRVRSARGGLLGSLGSLIGTRPALIGAAALASLALLRETGILQPAGTTVPQAGAGAVAVRAPF